MDDARIRQLTEEVLAQLGTPESPQVADLESRVAALEAAVRRLAEGAPAAGSPAQAPPAATATVVVAQVSAHPSFHLFGPKPAGERCCLEPDKPCTGSGQCRAFGH
jgi:hypothetical protein